LNNQAGNGGASAAGGAGGGAGLAGVASLIGSFMQANAGGGGSAGQGKAAASGAMQILSGIGSLLANAGQNGGRAGGSAGGFDPAIIGNVLEMFTNSDADSEDAGAGARSNGGNDAGIGLDSILQIASVFMNANTGGGGQQQQQQRQAHHQQRRSTHDDLNMRQNEVDEDSEDNGGLMSLLPLVMQAVSSFAGPEGQQTQERHKGHAWVLPPFLEHLHVVWDHFSNSELADALYEKSGVNKILKGFKGRDGKLDYDKLFDSLNNQSFRRRWIKSATLYLADWASYLANPEVFLK
ncbi:PREDICTED: protein PopA1-like, partial [Rhagoletis zephyria]|uniref:protein PopA1-like n=1 Tax=Rhagoletis zephyria TaxID=28612 RepID=UPI000811A944